MRLFSGVFGFIVLVFVMSFAFSNRQDVSVGLWPFADSLQTPLSVVGLAPLAFGFVVGGLLGWMSGLPHRFHARRLNKELGALNKKIGELQNSASAQRDKIKPKPFFWRRS